MICVCKAVLVMSSLFNNLTLLFLTESSGSDVLCAKTLQ